MVPLKRRHADDVVVLFADPAMSTHLGADLSDPDVARAMVDNRLAYEGPPELGHWVIMLDDDLIGLAHLRPSKELPGDLPEIGWYLSARHGGRGLATEAALALLRRGLDEMGLNSVWALVHVDQRPEPAVGRTPGIPRGGPGVALQRGPPGPCRPAWSGLSLP